MYGGRLAARTFRTNSDFRGSDDQVRRQSQPVGNAGSMAVNRIKGAFAAPRKGETFELRAGLVY